VHVEEAVGVDDGGVLSDAELAWRLHQELNAGPATLRTRMRKTTSGPGSGSSAPADANDMPEVSKRSSKAAGKGAPRGDRSEGNSAPAVKPESDHNEQEVKEEQVEPAKKAAPEAEGKGETTKEEEEPVSPRALRHQHRDTEPKAKQQSGNDAVKPAPAPVHRSRKGRPEPATEEGAPAPAPPAAKPAAARKPARPIKIPKLPMVLQAKQWYRARVLKETSEKVLVGESRWEVQ